MTDKDQSPTTLAEEIVAHQQAWKEADDPHKGANVILRAGRTLINHADVILAALSSSDPTAAYQRGREDMRREAAKVARSAPGRRHICPNCGLSEIDEAEERARWKLADRIADAVLALPQAKAAETGDDTISADAIGIIREIVAEGLGFNATFVDDDVRVAVGLAQRAILAGLISDFKPDMQRRFTEAAEKHRGEHPPTAASSTIDEAVRPKPGDTIAIRVVVESFGDGVVKFRSDDGTLAYRRVTDIVAPLPKPAPGQGELRYYTLGPNADRVCTRCEVNLSADARDHQWVHDQKRDEAVRAEREACAKIAEACAEEHWRCLEYRAQDACSTVAAHIRSRATTAEQEEGK